MSGGYYCIVESDNPEKLSECIEEKFNPPDKYHVEVLDEERIYVSLIDIVRPDVDTERWLELSDIISRIMLVWYNDTVGTVQGTLYKVNEDSLEEVDSERCDMCLSDSISEGSTENDIFYQGFTYLPNYFYDKYNFKMFDKQRFKGEMDYENFYSPETDEEYYPYEEYVCPICKSGKISSEGWDAECGNCGFQASVPWFQGYDKALSPYHYFYFDYISEKSDKYDKIEYEDVSKESDRYCIIEFDEDEKKLSVKIEETNLTDALNRSPFTAGLGEMFEYIILIYNGRFEEEKEPTEYSIEEMKKGIKITVNGEEVSNTDDFKLKGKSKGYKIYNIEIDVRDKTMGKLGEIKRNLTGEVYACHNCLSDNVKMTDGSHGKCRDCGYSGELYRFRKRKYYERKIELGYVD